MTEKNKNEELQSRRSFFKKAAKTVLPILGAILIGSTHIEVKASSKPATGCETTCTGCTGRCLGVCTGCENVCRDMFFRM